MRCRPTVIFAQHVKSVALQDARSTKAASKGRLLPALLSHFDVAASYSADSSAEGFKERLIRHLLDWQSEGVPAESADRASLRACLEEHLRRAACLTAPELSKKAAVTLKGYYLVSHLMQHPGTNVHQLNGLIALIVACILEMDPQCPQCHGALSFA